MASLLLVITLLILVQYFFYGKKKLVEGIKIPLVILVVSFSLLYGDNLVSIARGTPTYRTWNVFHYYLGSKYFDELGYFDLYTCALSADKEGMGIWSDDAPVRDLYTYEMKTAKEILGCPKGKFSQERWQAFTEDLTTLQSNQDFPKNVITDKGYNPTPFWTLFATRLSNMFSLNNQFTTAVLFNIDLIMIMAALIIVGFSFGRYRTVLLALFTLLYFGNYLRLAGNFFQYTWFFFVLVGASLFNKKHVKSSALFWAGAVMLRLFPLVLLSYPALKYLIGLFSKSKPGWWKTYHRFFVTFGVSLVLMFAVSTSMIQWSGFIGNVKLHSHYISGETFNIGLKNLVGTAAQSNKVESRRYAQDTVNVQARLTKMESLMPLYYVLAGLIVIFVVKIALIDFKQGVSNKMDFRLSFILLYTLLVLSPYYYVSLGLLLLNVEEVRSMKFSTYVVLSGFLLLPLSIHFVGGTYVNFNWAYQLSSEALILLFLSYLGFTKTTQLKAKTQDINS